MLKSELEWSKKSKPYLTYNSEFFGIVTLFTYVTLKSMFTDWNWILRDSLDIIYFKEVWGDINPLVAHFSNLTPTSKILITTIINIIF